ncbi:hypothetical protein BDF19DRAFT_445778 [Syncephalis fuscata]|nr:hypothetical protein BDF19DRAFT_445778 [Syncephalis fuscata]
MTDPAAQEAYLVSASLNSDDIGNEVEDDYFNDDDTLDFDAMTSALEITEQNFLSQQQQTSRSKEYIGESNDGDTQHRELTSTQTLRIPMTQPAISPLEMNILQKDGEISILRQKLLQTTDQLAMLQQELTTLKETTHQERQEREREYHREKSGLEVQLQFAKLEQGAHAMNGKLIASKSKSKPPPPPPPLPSSSPAFNDSFPEPSKYCTFKEQYQEKRQHWRHFQSLKYL